MHSKPSQFLARLAGWEGIIGLLIFLAVIGTVAGCSTKWEQKVGDYKASVFWGADFTEHEDEQ